jgi:CRP/FNR family transcriptional regulator, cyclic AMP receptor protein
MPASLCALLTQTWFASDMPPHLCERLSAIGLTTELAAGTRVVQEGLPCPSLGVILSGRVALRLTIPGVGERTILTIDDGDVFGWSALLPGSLATSTGVALVPTTALIFEREPLLDLLAADSDLAAAVYPRVLAAVARRLQATRLQLLDLYRPGLEPW